jgi:hypothetical protein
VWVTVVALTTAMLALNAGRSRIPATKLTSGRKGKATLPTPNIGSPGMEVPP